MSLKKNVSPEELVAATRQAIRFKGYPWSEVEFNATFSDIRNDILRSGATDAQLEKFEKAVNEAPIKTGRFNPWSGD